jgi:SAM-dependent methyltransferase
VLGVDIDEDAVAYARGRYGGPNVEFERLDVQELPLPDGSFDVVCSFETIEHLADPGRFLARAARVLKEGGLLLASTPRVERTTSAPENPHHLAEFAPADFEELLRRSFGEVELWGQRREETQRYRLARRLDVLGLRKRTAIFRPLAKRLLGTPATAELSTHEVVISPDGLARATEILAVCSLPHG